MKDFNLNINVKLTADEDLLKTLMSLVTRSAFPSHTHCLVAHHVEETPAVETLRPAEEAMASMPSEAIKEPEASAEQETPAKATATTQDVRDAMQKIRNKYEYGTPEAGEEKGPNEERDPKVKKALTKLFKELAAEIEEGKLPSELSPESRPVFIERALGIIMDKDGFVAPF